MKDRSKSSRKTAEEALIESEHRLFMLMANLPGMVYRCQNDKHWTMKFVSEGCMDLTGYPPEALTSNEVQYNELIYPDDREHVWNEVQMAVKEHFPFHLIYRIVKKDGTERWVKEQGQGMYDTENNLKFLEGYITDITEQKIAEEALRKSEEIFNAFLEYNPVYVFFKDHETRPVRLSKNYEQILGLPAENALGKTMDELFPGDLAKSMIADDLNVIRNGVPVKTEEELAGRYYETTKFPIIRPGKPNFLAGFTIDITERKNIEKELESNVNLLRNVIDSSNDAIYVKDLDQRIILCNKAYAWALGKPVEALNGHTDLENGWDKSLVKGDSSKGIAGFEAEDQAALEGQIVHLDNEQIEIEGQLYFFDTLKLPLRDKNGRIVGMFGISRDITQRRQTEEAIRKLNQELEQRVTDRTAQLTASNKELESFAYSISHDLRAPLRAINGFSLFLYESYADMLDDQGKLYLERIRAGARNMADLIDDLLNLSRVSRSEMVFLDVNLSRMATEIIVQLKEDNPDRKVEVEITSNLSVRGDALLLHSVMQNLLHNAWKFTSKHSNAHITFGEIQSEGKRVLFIRDDGAGFDMNYVKKLFGPFQRLHAAREFPGTGIGLAIVHRIIRRHGGQVWAESQIEKGATFYFTLS